MLYSSECQSWQIYAVIYVYIAIEDITCWFVMYYDDKKIDTCSHIIHHSIRIALRTSWLGSQVLNYQKDPQLLRTSQEQAGFGVRWKSCRLFDAFAVYHSTFWACDCEQIETAGCFRLCRAVFRSQYLNYAITRCLVSPCSKESLLCIYSQVYYDGRCEWNGTEICHSWFWKKWSDISLMTPAVNIHIQNFARHF